jgi:hypothetical protein
MDRLEVLTDPPLKKAHTLDGIHPYPWWYRCASEDHLCGDREAVDPSLSGKQTPAYRRIRKNPSLSGPRQRRQARTFFFIQEILGMPGISIDETGDPPTLCFVIRVSKSGFWLLSIVPLGKYRILQLEYSPELYDRRVLWSQNQ